MLDVLENKLKGICYNAYYVLMDLLVEGVVSPLGCGVENTWQKLVNSECGITAIESKGWLSQHAFFIFHTFLNAYESKSFVFMIQACICYGVVILLSFNYLFSIIYRFC